MYSSSLSGAILGALCTFGAGLAAAEQYPLPYVDDYTAYNDYYYGKHPNHTYMSTPMHGPLFQISKWDPARSGLDRYLFISSPAGNQKHGPYIIDTKDMSMVYGDPSYPSSNNPRIQEYNGLPYFTFWQGDDFSGHGLGQCVLYDSSYHQVYNITTKMINTKMDSHECQLTQDGTALVSAYEKMPFDMSLAPGGGPKDGVLLDSIFEELDVATGELKFLWRASNHFDINMTEVNWGPDDYGAHTEDVGWDFFHLNSLQKTHEGNYLVSGRRISTLVYVDGKDGSVLWQLGGKGNQFFDLSNGTATDFGFQHTARFINDNLTEITLFDNHSLDPNRPSPHCTDGCSRGLHLRLDFSNPKNWTVEVVHEYYHPKGIAAWAMGGFQKLSNGNVLVSWGTTPAITEYTEDGEIVLDFQLGPWAAQRHNEQPVYRAWTMDWTAYPTWAPSVAADDDYAYISWNGATEVDSWDLMEGNTMENITFTGNHKKVGFETVIPLKTNGAFVVANALAADGTILGTTDVWDMELGTTHPGGAAGYCTIGCGRFDDFDSLILLVMLSSAVLLIVMMATRGRVRDRSVRIA